MGQYFYTLYQKGKPIRRKYTHREDHYKFEFLKICEVQQLSETLIFIFIRAEPPQ